MRRNISNAKNKDGMRRFLEELPYILIRLRDDYESYDVIAEEYGVNRATVYKHLPVSDLNDIHFDDD